jgi:low affinity Fe/Cu permease
MREFFRKFAHQTAEQMGSAWAFLLAFGIIIVWLALGPRFHFSDTWQLIINTGTTIITFLMVFLIQNTQNRDAKAIHIKLNELIRALGQARNTMVDLEDLPDEDLEQLHREFQELGEHYHGQAKKASGERTRRGRK